MASAIETIRNMTESEAKRVLARLLFEFAKYCPCDFQNIYEEDKKCPCWDICDNHYTDTCEKIWLEYAMRTEARRWREMYGADYLPDWRKKAANDGE